jgi:threonine synthase
MHSFLTGLTCPRCGQWYPADHLINLCGCGSPLLASYNLEGVAAALRREDLERRPATLWRYHELLPVRDPRHVVTLGEGMTPLLPVPAAGAAIGLADLWLKDEGLNPTGTFKARGAAVGVSRARELGAQALALPTAGNAGGAWAAYAARAGLPLDVVLPADAPMVNQRETALAGARTHLVRGLISDAGAIVARYVQASDAFDCSTLKEPYRIEGKKTMGYEILEQLGWEPPGAIIYPAGGGVGIIGIWKALGEMRALGWLRGSLPRLVVVQAEGCRPIVEAWRQGLDDVQFWSGAATLAAGLRVPRPLGGALTLRAVRETGGTAVAVGDAEILEAMRQLAAAEGIWACPEGAAGLAAAARLRREGFFAAHDRVVVLNTGTGLKYPELAPVTLPVLAAGEDLPPRPAAAVGRAG